MGGSTFSDHDVGHHVGGQAAELMDHPDEV